MKLRIMQQGGGLIYTPFIPGAQSTTATASKSSSSNDDPKLDPLDKELISLMKDQNLLSSDIQQIYNRLIRFQKQTQRLSGLEGTDAYRSAMPGMLQILGMVNEAKSNKEDAKEVEERMIAENAGSDIALDNYGRMYVLSDGKLDTVAISKFDPEKHQALSNSQMLSYRENELPFDKSILSGLRNMVGMSSISKEIERMIKAIGTKEESQYITANANVKKVLSAIADGPDGIYKLSAKERSEGLQPAWKAIYDNLPRNMQNVIRANAAVTGTDYRAIIQDMVLRQTDTKFDVSYDSTISKAAGYNVDPNKTSEGGEKLDVKDTYAERLVTGNGLSPSQWINILPSNTGVSMYALSQGASYVLKDGVKMPTASLHSVLTQADAIGAIVDSQSVTFGDQLIDSRQFKSLMVDNDVEMKRVWLPAKTFANGRIAPDFEAQQRLDKIQQYVQNNSGISDTWIEEWLKNNLPQAKWNRDTKTVTFDQSVLTPFLVLHGVAGSNRVDFDTQSAYLYHNNRSDGRLWKDEYERIVKEVTNTDKQTHRKAKGSGSGKYYEGNIYLPILSPNVGSFVYNNQYFTKDTYTNITQKAENEEARRQIKSNF